MTSKDDSSDSDDDSDTDMDLDACAVDSKAQFYEEVADLLRTGLNDTLVYKYIVVELDQIRAAHSEDSTTLNFVVHKALISLPLLLNESCKNNLTLYARYLDDILIRYDSLLKNLKRNKEVQSQGVEAIKLPFKELAREGRIDRNQWLGNDVEEIYKVLLERGMVDARQWKDIVHEVDYEITSAMRLAEQQPQEQLDTPAITEALSETQQQQYEEQETATATCLPDLNMPSCAQTEEMSFDLCPENNLDIEEQVKELLKSNMAYDSEPFEAYFTSTGGELRHWTTDDFLEITPGAIPEGQIWQICGKIHTSLDNFKDAILKDEPKQFRSCVLEYRIESGPIDGNAKKFLRPITINIRHSVAEQKDREYLRVFCIEDDGQTIEILKHTDSTEGSPWFELHNEFLKIFTYQFCHYTCVCTASGTLTHEIDEFYVTLYGRMYPMPGKKKAFQVILDFALWASVKDGVQQLPEFKENFNYSLTERSQKKEPLVWQKVNIPATHRLQCNSEMTIEILLEKESSWEFNEDIGDSRRLVVTIKNIIPCSVKICNPIKFCKSYCLDGDEQSLTGSVKVSIADFNYSLTSPNTTNANVLETTKAVFNLRIATNSNETLKLPTEKEDDSRTSPEANRLFPTRGAFNLPIATNTNEKQKQPTVNEGDSETNSDTNVFEPMKGVFNLQIATNSNEALEQPTASGKVNNPLSDKNIMKIARRVSPTKIMELGVEMDLTVPEVEHIERRESNLNNKVRAIFDIIRQWRDKNLVEDVSLEELVVQLLNIFKELYCLEAMQLLQSLSKCQ